MSIKDKNIVITGAASGIGRALVDRLSQDNSLLAVDIHFKGLLELQHLYPNISIQEADLLEDGAVEKVMDRAFELWEKVDIYFANAGFGTYGSWHQVSEEQLQDIFRINVTVPFLTARALRKRQGIAFRLVVTASAVSYWAVPGYAVYSASKAAIHQLAAGIWAEGDGDWLTLVYPAATETDFFKKAGKNIPKAYPVQSSERVAELILKGVAKNKKRIYPSLLFRWGLIANRWIPLISPCYRVLERRKFYQWSNNKT
ncbi:SDR family NAD(P)-dependent oxidoreductase [Cecembia sp.]|uniref:SDR family NAD(P)-dependent oxidoreductase n=1 Tax=Cecembia sp. TaxID=1898110 RepID=UPI0025C26802|nr:SDR family NAD(P)-dependent oxidoreductase [Cecembia sp.]